MKGALVWAGLLLAITVPIILAALSPLLEWRQPIYIAAGFAGVAAFGAMLAQPLLARGALPGLTPFQSRKIHRVTGWALIALVLAHVIGLWITSPPDVIDVLLLRSPTPFSVWGVLAMWALFAVAIVSLWRKKLGLRRWRVLHMGLIAIIVPATIAHALLIEGTMETLSKWALSACLVAVCFFWLKIPWGRPKGGGKAPSAARR